MPASNSRQFRLPRLATASAFALVLAAAFAPQSASAAGFSPFAGSFHGGGSVIGSDGHRERISCRARGAVGDGGQSLSQSIVCASDSYRMDIRGSAVDDGGNVHGQWQETTRGVSGNLSGRLSGGSFSGGVSGGGFAASFALHASGRRLSFDLRPQGGDVARVEVSSVEMRTLPKAGKNRFR